MAKVEKHREMTQRQSFPQWPSLLGTASPPLMKDSGDIEVGARPLLKEAGLLQKRFLSPGEREKCKRDLKNVKELLEVTLA